MHTTPSIWIRRFHRWTSILFTLAVIANFVVMAQGKPVSWITYSPLLPLALLLLTGLYLFALPHVAKWKANPSVAGNRQPLV